MNKENKKALQKEFTILAERLGDLPICHCYHGSRRDEDDQATTDLDEILEDWADFSEEQSDALRRFAKSYGLTQKGTWL
jgi:hypothetical protein